MSFDEREGGGGGREGEGEGWEKGRGRRVSGRWMEEGGKGDVQAWMSCIPLWFAAICYNQNHKPIISPIPNLPPPPPSSPPQIIKSSHSQPSNHSPHP